ncbi:hypothetical protein [Cerasicoccus fimbriatus]|uniref:hypothetical protein n=1 Tax=Cerasicoccus fimbriatus TaxID=3014554 RepID=UPI0022B31ABD|nr:hypothetical protein [Cerasicoccus sp. TK19100]
MNSQQALQNYQQMMQQQMEAAETAGAVSLVILCVWAIIGLVLALLTMAVLWNLNSFLKVKTEETQFWLAAAEHKENANRGKGIKADSLKLR